MLPFLVLLNILTSFNQDDVRYSAMKELLLPVFPLQKAASTTQKDIFSCSS